MVLSIGFAVDSSAPDRDDCRLEYSLYNQYYRYGAYHLLQILSLCDDSRLYFGYFQYYMVYVLFYFPFAYGGSNYTCFAIALKRGNIYHADKRRLHIHDFLAS
jgi:hypothetical protein